jgi:hypothetical protein
VALTDASLSHQIPAALGLKVTGGVIFVPWLGLSVCGGGPLAYLKVGASVSPLTGEELELELQTVS